MFSLAMLWLQEENANVPQALVHLAQAASWGHIRALSVLSEAIVDPDSWLHRYERDQQRNSILAVYDDAMAPVPPRGDGRVWVEDPVYLARHRVMQQRRQTRTKDRESFYHQPHSYWLYKPGQDIAITVHGQQFLLRFPLHRSSPSLCEIALAIDRYLAEMTADTNALMKQALALYLEGNYEQALINYEDAADMGIATAAENAVYLMDLLVKDWCRTAESDMFPAWSSWWHSEPTLPPRPRPTAAPSPAEDNDDYYYYGDEEETVLQEMIEQFELNQHVIASAALSPRDCRRHWALNKARRLLQLVYLRSDPVAVQTIAYQMLHNEYPFDSLSLNHSTASSSSRPLVDMYAYYGAAGDASSLVALGWAYQSGWCTGTEERHTLPFLVNHRRNTTKPHTRQRIVSHRP